MPREFFPLDNVIPFLLDEDGSKTAQGRRGHLEEGAWDAIHVIEVSFISPSWI